MAVNLEFSKNLKYVCAEQVSIAHICRAVGINAQQFNRYLNGKGMPSAHNLRRICLFFGLTEEELLARHLDFVASRGVQKNSVPSAYNDPFAKAFPGDLSKLRPYMGSYNNYSLTPSWPGHVLVGAAFLHEHEGQMIVRSVERGSAPNHGPIQRTRFQGRAGFHGSRIFIVEFEYGQEGSVTETILYPADRQQRTYLRGITMGVAWRPRRMPYSERSIWKRASARLTTRQILSKCGVYPLNHRTIDPIVHGYLTGKIGLSGEETPIAE